jgi:hypothetical protein
MFLADSYLDFGTPDSLEELRPWKQVGEPVPAHLDALLLASSTHPVALPYITYGETSDE